MAYPLESASLSTELCWRRTGGDELARSHCAARAQNADRQAHVLGVLLADIARDGKSDANVVAHNAQAKAEVRVSRFQGSTLVERPHNAGLHLGRRGLRRRLGCRSIIVDQLLNLGSFNCAQRVSR